MGAYEKALPIYQRSLDIREKMMGQEHPAVATTLNNLAGLYESLDDHEKALMFIKEWERSKRGKEMKHIEVVAGIIMYKDRILCMQRDAGKYDYVSYKYEFPGGKVEPGETNSQALMRELREEMEVEINIYENDFFMTVTHQYPDFEVTMHSYVCRVSSPEFTRKKHINHIWLKRSELDKMDWAPADQPIVKRLMLE